jgi:LysM repeat protein
MSLLLPLGVAAVRAEPKAAPRRGAAPSAAGVAVHTVRPGESLWSISRAHGVTAEAIARANRIGLHQPIQVGARLAIPTSAIPDTGQEPPSPAEIILGRPPAAPALAFQWPIVNPSVASPFGQRRQGWHGGIDIQAGRGTPVHAAAAGMVIASGWEPGYGRVIRLWHPFDFMTLYAHNHENRVRVGDWVERGQVIASVGSTGRSTAPHLHFEIRLAGRKYDPLFWLTPPGSVEVADADRKEARDARP